MAETRDYRALYLERLFPPARPPLAPECPAPETARAPLESPATAMSPTPVNDARFAASGIAAEAYQASAPHLVDEPEIEVLAVEGAAAEPADPPSHPSPPAPPPFLAAAGIAAADFPAVSYPHPF